jgi:hypothetical protein
LSHIYPEGNSTGKEIIEWDNVKLKPERYMGALEYHEKIYPYLFWESHTVDSTLLRFTDQMMICETREDVVPFLQLALNRLGLNSREECGMITYWLPQLKEKEFCCIEFLENEFYSKIANLNVEFESGKIPSVIRVFMIFVAVETPLGSVVDWRSKVCEWKKVERSDSELVVEWGGSNLLRIGKNQEIHD